MAHVSQSPASQIPAPEDCSTKVPQDLCCGPNLSGLRDDFPALAQTVHGKPLIYLDNAATTQRPVQVVEATSRFYKHDNSNIHRGVHELSERATQAYEGVREKVRHMINAEQTREIIFTHGTTEAINMVAHSYGNRFIGEGDEVLITHMEHHSNIVPWQMLCERTGAKLRVAPIDDRGALIMEGLENLITERTKIVGVVHVSNALGTVNPVKRIIAAAHARGVPVLIDGAQAASHIQIDVRDLDADFYAFSGHKVYGPTGVGVLYGKEALLDKMPPFLGGGDMIRSVTFEKTIYNTLPYKFEAGTPNIAGVVGMGAAIDYVQQVCLRHIAAHEHEVLRYAEKALTEIPGLRLVGTPPHRAGVISFVIEGIHPHDIGTILDQEGVAIRTGHHCAQPVMQRLGVPATARASLGLYNTREDIDVLVKGIHRVLEVFG